MKFISYKVIEILDKGVKIEAVFDTETKIKVIQSTDVTRDKYLFNEDGSPVLNEIGQPKYILESFKLYDPKNPETLDYAIREWAIAYINGREQENNQKLSNIPSDEFKNLIGKKVMVEASAVDSA